MPYPHCFVSCKSTTLHDEMHYCKCSYSRTMRGTLKPSTASTNNGYGDRYQFSCFNRKFSYDLSHLLLSNGPRYLSSLLNFQHSLGSFLRHLYTNSGFSSVCGTFFELKRNCHKVQSTDLLHRFTYGFDSSMWQKLHALKSDNYFPRRAKVGQIHMFAHLCYTG